MRIFWIIILILTIVGIIVFLNRGKIWPPKGVQVDSPIPNRFDIKNALGNTTWVNENGNYFYYTDFGIGAGIQQKSTKEEFEKNYKLVAK